MPQTVNRNQSKFKVLSYVSYFVLCFSIVAKDYFGLSMSLNTIPFLDLIAINENGTLFNVLTYAFHAIIYALWVEIFTRFVYNSIQRVSFSTIDRYKFISVVKFVISGVNLLIGAFNFMYFAMPFTYKLVSVIETVILSITFLILYVIIYKKYLNKKSAPVIFLSIAIPLGIYFIFIAF